MEKEFAGEGTITKTLKLVEEQEAKVMFFSKSKAHRKIVTIAREWKLWMIIEHEENSAVVVLVLI